MKATKICKSLNKTLPIIQSSEEQREIVEVAKLALNNKKRFHICPIDIILFIGMVTGEVSESVKGFLSLLNLPKTILSFWMLGAAE